MAVALVACVAGLGGCSEDVVEIPDELRGEPYCVLVVDTFGHYDDGSSLLIADYAREAVAAACVCASEEEILSGDRDDELNDRALEECQRHAGTRDFAWDECLEDHASEQWLYVVFHAVGEDAVYKPPGFQCYGASG